MSTFHLFFRRWHWQAGKGIFWAFEGWSLGGGNQSRNIKHENIEHISMRWYFFWLFVIFFSIQIGSAMVKFFTKHTMFYDLWHSEFIPYSWQDRLMLRVFVIIKNFEVWHFSCFQNLGKYVAGILNVNKYLSTGKSGYRDFYPTPYNSFHGVGPVRR